MQQTQVKASRQAGDAEARTEQAENQARWEAIFAPTTGDLRYEAAVESAEFLGIPVDRASRLLDGAAARFTAEWRAKVQRIDAAAVTEFYNQSETELFDLLEWHATDPGNHRALVCADTAVERPGRRFLDYGSGVGSNALVFAAAGFDVTLADVSDRLLAFAKWRFERRGLSVRTLDLKREQPADAQFDVILCFDVLEHIPKPLPVIRRMRDALGLGGLLFLHAPFGFDPRRPMHVAYDDGVYRRFRAAGLMRQWKLENRFPGYLGGALPHVYERKAPPALERAAYYVQDVWVPERAHDLLSRVWKRVRE